MRQIRLLSEHTINQIAAGEVIENPASVVKELFENAIDAGSTQITVEIIGGGFELIRIIDNGSGMQPEDAALSIERHATSKLSEVEDLSSLYTMGFRGEALATIGAISKMTLSTSADGKIATRLEVEGGKVVKVERAARLKGTTIEVRFLFYNVPARKKFQKSASASSAEITRLLTHLALAHPECGIELIQQEESLFSCNAAHHKIEGLKERTSLLLSEHFGQEEPLLLELEKEGVKIQGMVGSPLSHRPNRTGQYLFINNRPVVSPPISFAVREAYGTRLDKDRHPVYVLHLSIPPDQVDVNVHPQKKEVRLLNEKEIKNMLHQAVFSSLQKKIGAFEVDSVFVQAAPIEWVYPEPKEEDFVSFPMVCREKKEEKQLEWSLPTSLPFSLGLLKHYWLVDAQSVEEVLPSLKGKPLGLLVVDLLAALSRVTFDQMTTAKGASQGLLFPLSISLNREEALVAPLQLEKFHAIGIEARMMGKETLCIEALPPCIDMEEAPEYIHALLLGEEESFIKKTAVFVSCRQKTFGLQEAQELFKNLLLTTSPWFCPRGKPTMIHMGLDEIGRRFT